MDINISLFSTEKTSLDKEIIYLSQSHAFSKWRIHNLNTELIILSTMESNL